MTRGSDTRYPWRMTEPTSDGYDPEDPMTVCPVHWRFIPCRKCLPGQEQYSTDPDYVRYARVEQQGIDRHRRAPDVLR